MGIKLWEASISKNMVSKRNGLAKLITKVTSQSPLHKRLKKMGVTAMQRNIGNDLQMILQLLFYILLCGFCVHNKNIIS